VELPPWLTIEQVAQYCEVDRAAAYKMLPNLEIRRIGVRGGVMPFGRLIRVERGSLLQVLGEPVALPPGLPRWVTMRQAAEHYQVSPRLIRALIAHQQLEARRIGSSKTIRVDRDSLLELGRYRAWVP
jgi:hypothetical protein